MNTIQLFVCTEEMSLVQVQQPHSKNPQNVTPIFALQNTKKALKIKAFSVRNPYRTLKMCLLHEYTTTGKAPFRMYIRFVFS